MRIFYVDYENVQSVGLESIELLDENDKVIIFYSDHADSMKIEIVRQLMSSKAQVEFVIAETGTLNALDFQLVACLFLDIKAENQVFIVSRDTGFDAAIGMGKKRDYNDIKRIPSISSLVKEVEVIDEMADEICSFEVLCDLHEAATTKSMSDNTVMIESIIRDKCGDMTCRKYAELIITGVKKSSNKQHFL